VGWQADFTEHRLHRAFDTWKRAMWDAGLKLPTQVAGGRSTCFCGAAIGIADTESYVSADHIQASLLKATVTNYLMTRPHVLISRLYARR
jgi:hypothetical protein